MFIFSSKLLLICTQTLSFSLEFTPYYVYVHGVTTAMETSGVKVLLYC